MRRDDVVDEVTVFDRDIKSELPEGWRWSSIGELTRVIRGASPRPAGHPRFFGGNAVPWITVGSITGDSKVYLDSTTEFLTEEGRLKSRYVEPGTLLLTNSGATLGVPKITRIGGCINDGSVALLDIDNPLKLYLFYLLKSKTERLRNIRQGAAQPNLNTGIVKAIPVPLAPEREQHRIVSKIEELFSDLDAGVAALERAKANLKRYRESVLKAAVEGRLTADWRAANPNAEPASELLQRILTTRRQNWEENRRAEFERKGKKPPAGWMKKYSEPLSPNTKYLPDLPPGWCWASPEQLASADPYSLAIGPFGSNLKVSDYTDSGVPLVFVRNIRSGVFGGKSTKYVNIDKAKELSAHGIDGGDILITKMGEPPGDAILYPSTQPHAIITADCIKLRLSPLLTNPQYFVYAINSKLVNRQIQRITQGVAQKKISLGRFSTVAIPLPPLDEQIAFLREIDACSAIVETLIGSLEVNRIRSDRLRQSILNRAFAGELVPQVTIAGMENQLIPHAQVKSPDSTKTGTDELEPREPNTKSMDPKLIPYTPKNRIAIRFRRFAMPAQFRSLRNVDVTLRRNTSILDTISPICLVGLNGSGKSNLIELVGSILCDIELSLLGYKKVHPQELFNIPFTIEYDIIGNHDGTKCSIKISCEGEGEIPNFSCCIDEDVFEVNDALSQFQLLPARVIAYSSGHNETVSVPFLRSQAHYVQEVLAETQGHVIDAKRTRTIFLDDDCNANTLISNFIFADDTQLALFRERVRIRGLQSFTVTYRLKRKNAIPVVLTESLEAVIVLLRSCSTHVTKNDASSGESFHFEIDRSTLKKLRDYFIDAQRLFGTLHRLSQLNCLSQTKKEREYYLNTNASTDMLSRPPRVSREERVFAIDDVMLELTTPRKVIPYEGLSDGEHQYMQVIGSILLFQEPGTLFLFDEPETHFNPHWRRHFVDDMNSFSSTSAQEMIVSTHSPFVVSGCQRDGVFRFTRKGDRVEMHPVNIETFGTSFELLLAELFGLESMISEQAINEMKKALSGASSEELMSAASHFGESMEKRFLFQRAAELRKAEDSQ